MVNLWWDCGELRSEKRSIVAAEKRATFWKYISGAVWRCDEALGSGLTLGSNLERCRTLDVHPPLLSIRNFGYNRNSRPAPFSTCVERRPERMAR
jgi:hypothetical protein